MSQQRSRIKNGSDRELNSKSESNENTKVGKVKHECHLCQKVLSSKQRLQSHYFRKHQLSYLSVGLSSVLEPSGSRHEPVGSVEGVNRTGRVNQVVEWDMSEKQKNWAYVCEYCDRSFTRKDNLRTHIKSYCKKSDNCVTERKSHYNRSGENYTNGRSNVGLSEDASEVPLRRQSSEVQTVSKKQQTSNTINQIHVVNIHGDINYSVDNSVDNSVNIVDNSTKTITLGDVNYDIGFDKTMSYLKQGTVGDVKFLKKIFYEDIREKKPNHYPLECSDPSRNKYSVQIGDERQVIGPLELMPIICNPLKRQYIRSNNAFRRDYMANEKNPDIFDCKENQYCQNTIRIANIKRNYKKIHTELKYFLHQLPSSDGSEK